MEVYCVKDNRNTPNVAEKQPQNAQGQVCGLRHNKNKVSAGNLTEPSLAEGAGVFTDIAGTATDLFFSHGVSFLAKKGLEAGRYYASKAMRNPALQKKVMRWDEKSPPGG